MLYSDILIYLSDFCDFKTRLHLKMTCKYLSNNIHIEKLKDDTIITYDYISNPDNYILFIEYFIRNYVKIGDVEEPYLIIYPLSHRPYYDQSKIWYSNSPGKLLYEKYIKPEEENFFETIREFWMKFLIYSGSEKDYLHQYEKTDYSYKTFYLWVEIWDNMVNKNYTYFCHLIKLNPNSSNIQNGRYIGKLWKLEYDFMISQ